MRLPASSLSLEFNILTYQKLQTDVITRTFKNYQFTCFINTNVFQEKKKGIFFSVMAEV